jgi:hypothetical protein
MWIVISGRVGVDFADEDGAVRSLPLYERRVFSYYLIIRRVVWRFV